MVEQILDDDRKMSALVDQVRGEGLLGLFQEVRGKATKYLNLTFPRKKRSFNHLLIISLLRLPKVGIQLLICFWTGPILTTRCLVQTQLEGSHRMPTLPFLLSSRS